MPDRMSEAEVNLRLAFWLFATNRAIGNVRVAIDGAQVAQRGVVHFPLQEFMESNGWNCGHGGTPWQGDYRCSSRDGAIQIHSQPGVGDVVAKLRDNSVLRVESKKGPLTAAPASPEYSLLRSALGHVLTLNQVNERDIIAVAVPKSERFSVLAQRWREAPLLKRCGIRILLVGRDNKVEGLDEAG